MPSQGQQGAQRPSATTDQAQPRRAAQGQPVYLTKYHVREQTAYALLGPIRAQLAELERRTRHYASRVHMEEEDVAPVRAAEQAIARARQEVERLWQESGARYGR